MPEEMLESLQTAKRNRLKSQEQFSLETSILKYQEGLSTDNKYLVDDAYKEICAIYQPLNYRYVWYKKYHYLYDTEEDFISDYLRIFCISLSSWKPKHLRKKSKFNGTGHFKNYFWSSLQNNYINMVKAENSGKRSISSKCPICDEWCSSLSTHLIQHHEDFLWTVVRRMGYDVEKLSKCPFCQSYKIKPKPVDDTTKQSMTNRLKRHILSMHTNYLFEEFKDQYPEYNNLTSKPSSIYVNEENNSDGELSIYDIVEKNTCVEDLFTLGLSKIQQIIVNKVFNENIKNLIISYDENLYNCKEEEFQKELEDLKNKLFLCGIN